jgi:phytoene desaturase
MNLPLLDIYLFYIKENSLKMTKNIIVIGAGVGGISTAARLGKKGYKVTVVEKCAQAGGRCNYFEKDGHSFDTGPTLYVMPEIYAQIFADLGEKLEEYIELLRIDPTYRIYFHDNSKFNLTYEQKKMRLQMETIEPKSFDALQKYLEEGEEFYKKAMSHLINRDFHNLFDFFNLKNLFLFFKLKLFSKHYDYINKFFKNPKLKKAFTYQDFYLGLSPYEAPATFSLLSYIELKNGVWLPKGGMYSFVKSLITIAEKFGVNFIYKKAVNQINVKDDKVTGVTLSDYSELNCDIVVANADLTYVYNHLLPNNGMKQNLMKKKYTCSTITFHWGIDKQYKQLGTHNLFLSRDYFQSFNQIINDLTLPEDPNFYIHTPVKVDPTRAPKGQETLTVTFPVGHINEDNPQNWESIQKKAKEIVLKRLARIGITDIEKHIKFEMTYTPNDWLKLYNLTKGSTLGLAHNLTQIGYMRPHCQHKRYKNLYFVGASTHPGSGVPSVIISSKFVSQRIIRNV